MQTLKLADDLFPNLIYRLKHATIRNGKRDIEPGLLIFEATDGTMPAALVDVRRIVVCRAKALRLSEIEEDGFASHDDLISGMRRFYPNFAPDSIVTFIEFEYRGDAPQ